MPILVYAVLPGAERAPPRDVRGVGGEAIRSIQLNERVSAWVSDSPATLSRDERDVRAHAAVVDAAMSMGMERDATPIPWRYGAVFESDAACRVALVVRLPDIEGELERLAGLVEMTLAMPVDQIREAASEAPGDARALTSETVEEKRATGAGRAYLDSIRMRQGLAQNVNTGTVVARRRISEIVGALARDEIAYVAPASPTALLVVAHLVHRGDVTTYRERAQSISIPGVDGADVRILIAGPHAPYRFISLSP